jgi:hypothetical protein
MDMLSVVGLIIAAVICGVVGYYVMKPEKT